jgi:hypothetical protein
MTPSYWDDVYAQGSLGLSWFQDEARVSLELIDSLGIGRDEPVVDVGGGASPLAGELLEQGFTDLTVLDLAETAMSEASGRLGPLAEQIVWLRQDVLAWAPDRTFGLWHDRAAFHFLVDAAERSRYLEVLDRAVDSCGAVIMATFAKDGPGQCSGLSTCRYEAFELAALLAPGFEVVERRREEHLTPGGAVQPFTWVALRRTPGWAAGTR